MTKFKRFISVVLVFMLTLGLIPVIEPTAPSCAESARESFSNDLEINEEIDPVVAQTLVDIAGSLSGGYGSNGKFLAPTGAPVAGSIPISSRAELENIKNNLSGNYHLIQDIDLSGAQWTPIGDYDNPFEGAFDGQGCVIRNLAISGDYEYSGLFGYARYATIKNIGVEGLDINISTSSYDAFAGGICGRSSSPISNCYSIGDVSAASDPYAMVYAGGICGSYSSFSISDCYNVGSVSASSRSFAYSGGICGYYYSGTSLIRNCYNKGDVSASSACADAGGICASYSDFGASSSINNCYNTGNVFAFSESPSAYADAGGICGFSYGSPSITNCYNTGDVSASSTDATSSSASAGGICYRSSSLSNCYNTGTVSAFSNSSSASANGIGAAWNSISYCYNTGVISASSHEGSAYAGGIDSSLSDSSLSNCYNIGSVIATSPLKAYAGGICGVSGAYYDDFSISNCYNIGSVSATSSFNAYVGGICGFTDSDSSSIINCYWMLENDQIVNGDLRSNAEKRRIGNETDTTAGRLTSTQMKEAGSFVGFNFDIVWDISPVINEGYPFLRDLSPNGGDTVLPGDVSGDGKINMQDVLLIYQNFRRKVDFTSEQFAAADVSGDGEVNMADVLLVYQYFRGMITGFPS